MSVGDFRIQGYTIRLYETTFRISNQEKNYSLNIMGAYGENNSERIAIRVINPLSARIETETSIFHINYIEDEYEPNGQFEIDVKISGEDVPIWTSLINGIPREVIRIIVCILNGDDEVETYRISHNDEDITDPEGFNEPFYNNVYTNSSVVGTPTNGGKRRTQKKRKSKQRQRKA